MKKNYVGMVMTPVGFELRKDVLIGSLTTVKIDINEVSVEDFHKDESFVDEGQDFKSISFD